MPETGQRATLWPEQDRTSKQTRQQQTTGSRALGPVKESRKEEEAEEEKEQPK